MTPSEMSVTELPTNPDGIADDAMLARLDFSNDALTLNLGALTRFGNPFLVDVVTSTLLAVAIAEATRGRKNRNRSQDNFEPPPPSFTLTHQKENTAKAFKDSFVEGFQGVGGKSAWPPLTGKGLRKFASSFKSTTTRGSESTSRKPSFDKDIELGEWYGQDKYSVAKETGVEKKGESKKDGDESRLPFVARTLIAVISLTFKTVVWVVKILFKIVSGVVVMLCRNSEKL